MSWLPDDIREASGGEVVDQVSRDVLRLAHQAIERFPEMKKRHMVIAGGAALSSALIVGAGVAIVRRIRSGQTPEEAVSEVTAEELNAVRFLERDRHARRAGSNGTREAHGSSGERQPGAPEGDEEPGTGAEAAAGG